MWSAARYCLHLTSDEFYALTPRQLDALMRRYRHETESRELLFGQLTSWVANTGFRTAEKPTTALDFMPSRWGRQPKSQSPEVIVMTPERRAALAARLHESLGQVAKVVK